MNRWFVLIAGMTAIIWVGLYLVFRLGTVVFSYAIIGGPINQIVMLVFWLAEIFILTNTIGYFINILAALKSYRAAAIAYQPSELVPVTIVIPAHNEPPEMLRKTVTACRYMDYPAMRIALVDASDDPERQASTKNVALEQGIDYFLVPKPRHGAKAGSLNEFLPQIKTKYFVVFDADYRPSRDFLKRLVAQMERQPDLAFIQTPQFYGNLVASPVARAAQMQQSIFYEYICEGKSRHQAMFMCGTNMIMRTKAMRQAGGFVESSITEDFATSLNVLGQGWISFYDNRTAAFGEGPRNLAQYFRQQYRWARGTIGVFLTRLPDILTRRSKLRRWQRMEFYLAGSYYFVGFAWMVLFVMPIIYIFFHIPVYFSDPVLYVLAYFPYFMLSLSFFLETILSRRYHGYDWLASQSLFLLSLPVYIRAAIDAVFRRPASFLGTKKDADYYSIPWSQLKPQIILAILNAIAIIYAFWQIGAYGFQPSIAINIVWATLHEELLLYFPLILYAQKRQALRLAGAGRALPRPAGV